MNREKKTTDVSHETLDFDISDFLITDDEQLEFNLEDFDLKDIEENGENGFIKPVFNKKPIKVDYENAVSLARKVKLFKGEQLHSIVTGSFIFVDFIEALLTEKNVSCEEMYISTLGMSQGNADSLAGLFETGHLKKLSLTISNYFYSHERNGLIKYMYDIFKGKAFDLIVFRNHTKIVLMKIDELRLVITGSANLRSSNCIEQFIIQESEELYSHYEQFFKEKAEIYSITKKE
jgi:hypothetical protein